MLFICQFCRLLHVFIQCDISSFDGVNLDLHNGDSIKKESGEKMFSLKMEKGAAGCKSTMRAIVNDNESEGNRCIGPDFDGSLVITRSFDIPKSIVGQIEKVLLSSVCHFVFELRTYFVADYLCFFCQIEGFL